MVWVGFVGVRVAVITPSGLRLCRILFFLFGGGGFSGSDLVG